MNGWTDIQTKVPCVLQDFVPFRGTKQGNGPTGIADHIMPLGDLFFLQPLLNSKSAFPRRLVYPFYLKKGRKKKKKKKKEKEEKSKRTTQISEMKTKDFWQVITNFNPR